MATYKDKLFGSGESGTGKSAILLITFAMGLLALQSSGVTGLAVVFGALPLMLFFILITTSHSIWVFWVMCIANFFIMFLNREIYMPIPASLPTEMLCWLLIALAVINVEQMRFEKFYNLMFFAIMLWMGFCFLEIFNNTCGTGIELGAWYGGIRLMALNILLYFLVVTTYIDNPKAMRRFIFLWAVLSLFAVFWIWKQEYIGFTPAEKAFLANNRTHVIGSGIRYFSIYTDAANAGCSLASSAAVFIPIGLTTKLRWKKIFYLLTGFACVWGFFQTGTRTALFCFMGGLGVYTLLSKSFKIMTIVGVVGGLMFFILAFTNIGQGNAQIRRMRSGFNKEDASMNVRDINKAAIAKYLADAPWGIGIGREPTNIPSNNKWYYFSKIPPDSTYVWYWKMTGKIGLIVFLISIFLMFAGACHTVLFRLHNKALVGLGSGICGAFVGINLGGYANNILTQFPNALLFFGGLAIVYILPEMEDTFTELEAKEVEAEQERRRKRMEKKKAWSTPNLIGK